MSSIYVTRKLNKMVTCLARKLLGISDSFDIQAIPLKRTSHVERIRNWLSSCTFNNRKPWMVKASCSKRKDIKNGDIGTSEKLSSHPSRLVASIIIIIITMKIQERSWFMVIWLSNSWKLDVSFYASWALAEQYLKQGHLSPQNQWSVSLLAAYPMSENVKRSASVWS